MTMNQELRQAAAQAKEALEDARYKLYGYGPSNPRLDAALSALSAVLEKQDSSHLAAPTDEARSGSGVPARPTLPGESVLVPREPTREMLDAAIKTADHILFGMYSNEECGTDVERADKSNRLYWSAMVAASPLPQEGRTPLLSQSFEEVLRAIPRGGQLFTVVESPDVPADEIHIKDGRGHLVGRITGIAIAGTQGEQKCSG